MKNVYKIIFFVDRTQRPFQPSITQTQKHMLTHRPTQLSPNEHRWRCSTLSHIFENFQLRNESIPLCTYISISLPPKLQLKLVQLKEFKFEIVQNCYMLYMSVYINIFFVLRNKINAQKMYVSQQSYFAFRLPF